MSGRPISEVVERAIAYGLVRADDARVERDLLARENASGFEKTLRFFKEFGGVGAAIALLAVVWHTSGISSQLTDLEGLDDRIVEFNANAKVLEDLTDESRSVAKELKASRARATKANEDFEKAIRDAKSRLTQIVNDTTIAATNARNAATAADKSAKACESASEAAKRTIGSIEALALRVSVIEQSLGDKKSGD